MTGSIGALRGDMGEAITSIRVDLRQLADAMGLQNAAGELNLNETILQAGTAFEEQRQTMQATQQTVAEQQVALQQASDQFGALKAEMVIVKSDLQTVHGMVQNMPGINTTAVEAMLQEHVKRTKDSVLDIEDRLRKIQDDRSHGHDDGGGGRDRHRKGYLPVKHLIPEPFENKMGECRQWLGDLLASLRTATQE